MSSAFGAGRRSGVWVALVAVAALSWSCNGASGSGPPAGNAFPSLAAGRPGGSTTTPPVGDCCAPATKPPYALVTARPTAQGNSRPAATPRSLATPGRASVTLRFDEQVFDENRDGLIDKLVLTPTITVRIAGNYAVEVLLLDPSGVEVARTATGGIPLVGGQQPLPLTFNGADIYKSGRWGPYRPVVTIVYFGLFTTTQLEDAELDLTQGYDYMQFQHTPVGVDPKSISSKAIDTNGDGLFDELDLTGTVTVDNTGLYHVNSSLYAKSTWNYVAAEYTEFQFVAGPNSFTVVYKGSDIARSAADGPYVVPDILVYLDGDPTGGGSSQGDVNFTTAKYKASEFRP